MQKCHSYRAASLSGPLSIKSLSIFSVWLSAVTFNAAQNYPIIARRVIRDTLARNLPLSGATVKIMAPQLAFIGLGNMGQVYCSVRTRKPFPLLNVKHDNRPCAKT